MNAITSDFVTKLPKIELHAHLSGSIPRECLQSIWEDKRKQGLATIETSPAEALPAGKYDFDINTFFPLFSSYIYALINDESSIRQSTNAVLQDFAADGVVYLELRTTPRALPAAGISKERYVKIILECIKAFADSNPKGMLVQLILSIDRSNTTEQAVEAADLAIKYSLEGVVGVDLCGNPSKGDVAIYRDTFKKAKDHGLGITLHFAEVPASSTDLELETLLSFEPNRLGHVVHVKDSYKKEIADRMIGLELCLSCNVLAKMTEGGFSKHHFAYWRHTDCPIALSTDDVGIFGSTLSNEYFLAAQHFNLSKLDLINLAARPIATIFNNKHKQYLYELYSIARTDLLQMT